jgi:hypothetical protein
LVLVGVGVGVGGGGGGQPPPQTPTTTPTPVSSVLYKVYCKVTFKIFQDKILIIYMMEENNLSK